MGPRKILMMHLDLGIGGAENLVVQVACCLQKMGYVVDIYTTHHNVNHCFEETKPDGVLGKNIHVHGDFLPRNFFGLFTALFAIIRMMYLAYVITTWLDYNEYDCVIIDGVSAPIPTLRWGGYRVLYYCHFPDLLLCTDRSSWLKRRYRDVMDSIEAHSTSAASRILVNSGFTRDVFKKTFPAVYEKTPPSILYPVVPIVEGVEKKPRSHLNYCRSYTHVFLSLNRFERKKKIEVAIDAFKHFKAHCPHHLTTAHCRPLLVIAGGYDARVQENVDYLLELQKYCDSVGLAWKYATDVILRTDTDNTDAQDDSDVDVIFRTSISSAERSELFSVAKALLYTPDKEHFGIVPIEAMMHLTPVIAVNSGGPVESVGTGGGGLLVEQGGEPFGEAMLKLVTPVSAEAGVLEELGVSMGKKAREHVVRNFSEEAMMKQLAKYLQSIEKKW